MYCLNQLQYSTVQATLSCNVVPSWTLQEDVCSAMPSGRRRLTPRPHNSIFPVQFRRWPPHIRTSIRSRKPTRPPSRPHQRQTQCEVHNPVDHMSASHVLSGRCRIALNRIKAQVANALPTVPCTCHERAQPPDQLQPQQRTKTA